jgi:hypothetical protein
VPVAERGTPGDREAVGAALGLPLALRLAVGVAVSVGVPEPVGVGEAVPLGVALPVGDTEAVPDDDVGGADADTALVALALCNTAPVLEALTPSVRGAVGVALSDSLDDEDIQLVVLPLKGVDAEALVPLCVGDPAEL